MTNKKPIGHKVPRPRLLFIDNLRILLTILVIMHHFAIGYGGPGGFYYVEDGPMSDVSEILMTLFLAINQAFFMGFFFMISSYFSPGSVDRKGGGTFLKDRLKRLGIPLLLYILVIAPVLSYVSARLYGFEGTFWQFQSTDNFYFRNLNASQMWFVAALLVFAVVYVIWRRFTRPTPHTEGAAPGNAAIAIFALALGVLTFTVRLWIPVGNNLPIVSWQLAHFPQYIALYILGLVAYRRGWFEAVTDAQGKSWFFAALGLIVFFPVLLIVGGVLEGMDDVIGFFFGGFHWQSFVYAVWEQFMCLAMVITLLVWFRKRFTEQGRLAKTMSGAAYATYVFHAPAIILLAIALRGIRLDMGLKYMLVVPFAVGFAFLVGYIVKKLPAARDIL